jgi:hypothetical protein
VKDRQQPALWDAMRPQALTDTDSTTAVYGRDVAFKNVLLGKVSTPEVAKPFVQSVAKAASVAVAKEAADNEPKK